MLPASTAGPRQQYAQALERPDWQSDPAQAKAVEILQQIHDQLLAHPPRRLRHKWPPVRGLYLWGSVGRGKTWLMDRFYEALPFSRKQRSHFHRFMQLVHELRGDHRQRRDPLRQIARELAHDRVLCFDEFHVGDVADAMILGRLATELFARGVTLVATSNTAPDELYAGGLQRQRFLPAIDAIHEHCHVLKLDDGIDYRLQMLQRAKIYHQPLDGQAEQRLAACFLDIAGGHSAPAATLTVLGRGIATRRLADGVVWFDFPALCEGARSVADYIEIARCFHTVLLAGIPVLSADDDNAARRLIHLVDELYDRNVKLIVSAAAPPEELYQGKKLAFAFQRTASRLHEMGSRGYLGSAHRP